MLAIPLIFLSVALSGLGSPLACTNTEAVRNGGFEQGKYNATYWTISGGGIRTHLYSDPNSYVIYGYPNPTVTQVLQCVQPGVKYVFSANMTTPDFNGNTAPVVNKASIDGVNIPLTQNGLKYYGTATAKQQSPTLQASSSIKTDNSLDGAFLDNVSFKKAT